MKPGYRRKSFDLPIGMCELIKLRANECDPPITQSEAAEHLLMLGDMTFQEQRVLLKSADEEAAVLKEIEEADAALESDREELPEMDETSTETDPTGDRDDKEKLN